MILYFSGTGNSKYVAKRIADALGDALVNLNDRIKASDTSSVETGERVIIVTPTYAWRIPRVVRDWLRKTELRGMGTAQIVMPENYIAMFSAPQADKARQIVAKAEPSIDRAIAAIQSNQPFVPTRNNLYDRFMSGPVNPIFYKFFVKADAFTVSDACIGCGQCAKRCPMNNVTLKGGKPVWGKVCTHCMACICYCPVSAIEYGKKSVGQPRYHFEAL
mgnify:CR=1 FL=1